MDRNNEYYLQQGIKYRLERSKERLIESIRTNKPTSFEKQRILNLRGRIK